MNVVSVLFQDVRDVLGRVRDPAQLMGDPDVGVERPLLVVDSLPRVLVLWCTSGGHEGFLVPSGRAEALADRLLTLAEQPHLRAKMGAEARHRVQSRFNIAGMVRRVEEVYLNVLSSEGNDSREEGSVPANSSPGPDCS